jgi:SAM-dependent methyltransferase
MADRVEAQRAHFESIASTYIEGRSGRNHLAYKAVMWNEVLAKLAQHLPANGSLIGLEAMCGSAETSARLVESFPNLTMDAFDLSESMVHAADDSLAKKVRVFQKDILQLEERDAYDFAVIIGGLHHIAHDVDRGVRNICNALKEGGIFLNLEPTHNNVLWQTVRTKIYSENAIFEENSERAFTLKEYSDCLASNGFAVEDQFYPGLLGYVLYYNPDAFPMLNVGPPAMAKALAWLDLRLGTGSIGKYLSFCTWTIARRSSEARG